MAKQQVSFFLLDNPREKRKFKNTPWPPEVLMNLIVFDQKSSWIRNRIRVRERTSRSFEKGGGAFMESDRIRWRTLLPGIAGTLWVPRAAMGMLLGCVRGETAGSEGYQTWGQATPLVDESTKFSRERISRLVIH